MPNFGLVAAGTGTGAVDMIGAVTNTMVDSVEELDGELKSKMCRA